MSLSVFSKPSLEQTHANQMEQWAKPLAIALIIFGMIGYLISGYYLGWSSWNALTLGSVLSASGIVIFIVSSLRKEPTKEPHREKVSAPLSVANLYWKDPEALLSDDMVEKVNHVSDYLTERGFELKGVAADGNCFFSAFLGSYNSLSIKNTSLTQRENPGQYLRNSVADKVIEKGNLDRGQQIKIDQEWVSADEEGALLAEVLEVPMRVITVQKDSNGCGISDMLFSENSNLVPCEWGSLEDTEKPSLYIFMIDLGGHFIYAAPR